MSADPKPGQRARLTIAEAVYDHGASFHGIPYWRVKTAGGDYLVQCDTPGLSWEALPDPLPVEDRSAIYRDRYGYIWSWSVTLCLWCRVGSASPPFPWECLVRERGPLRRYVEDKDGAR